AYPGMGMLLVNAITQRDYPLIQATVLVFTLIVITVNLLTDIAYKFVDPRITFD
ncbi:MAG: ABC transporter permease subunit, partial [Lachnospiraceae bacterium]|nr:ABC transporter permease subunit [Lachnospiraceae bacterium]